MAESECQCILVFLLLKMDYSIGIRVKRQKYMCLSYLAEYFITFSRSPTLS